MKNVLISFLTFDKDDAGRMSNNEGFVQRHRGTSLRNKSRRAGNIARDDLWRPAVAMARYHELEGDTRLVFNKYYLLYSPEHINQPMLSEVLEDIKAKAPEGEDFTLITIKQEFTDPYDFKSVYKFLYKLSQEPEFHDPDCRYFVNCTSGTYVMRSCLFALTQEGCFPGVRIEPRPWLSRENREDFSPIGYYELDDPRQISEVRHQIVTGVTPRRTSLAQIFNSKNKNLQKVLNRIQTTVKTTIGGKHIIDPILITGASGSGKTSIVEHIAEKIWKKKFYRLNCAELRGDTNLALSRLFGHTEQAFTGCGPETNGIFQEADGGVLFLDEVGELHPEAQALLLTALEHRPDKTGYQFTKLGSTVMESSNFHLICGTNRILEDDPGFRKDLLARISTWHFELPSLVERREDLATAKQWPLDQFKKDYGFTKDSGMAEREFSQEAEKLFLDFAMTWDWSGNFREFNDMIRRMATLSGGRVIGETIVQQEIDLAKAARAARELRRAMKTEEGQPAQPAEGTPPKPAPNPLKDLIGDKAFDAMPLMDRLWIEYVAELCTSGQAPRSLNELAEILKMKKDRSKISKDLKRYGIAFDRGSLHLL